VTGLELYSHSLLDDQLWYVAHPVHPADDEVTDGFRRLQGYVGGSPGERELREIREEIIRANIANAKAWLAWLIRAFPTITFIAPWIAALDGGGDDDLVPEQRARGLRDCCRTIRRCSGMVHVGGRVSSGMAEEARVAVQVVDLTSFGRRPPALSSVDPFRFAHAPSSEDSR
jgi:hypothetical protein